MFGMWNSPASDESELSQFVAVKPVDVRVAAMDFLARREHSRRELQQKLLRRFPDQALIDEQLDRLAQENLQSDERYAQSLVRSRSGRGYGPQRLRQEMREKGLKPEEVAIAFEVADINWYDVAEHALRKKFGSIDCRDIKQLARCQRFMHYRGFSREHYQHLLES